MTTHERGPGQSQAATQATSATGSRRNGLPIVAAIGLLALLDASYVLNAMDRQVFPVLVPPIRDYFGFSLAQGGLLSTVFTLGIGLAGLPAGYLIDRYTRKNVILVGIFVFSGFTLAQAFSFGLSDMAFYRVLSGVGEGVQNAALFATLGAYFQRRRALALGTLNFCYGLGSFLGPLFGVYLLQVGDTWRMPFYIYAAIGLALLIAIAVTVPRKFTERDPSQVHTGGREERASAGAPSRVLFNRNVIACAVAAAVIGFSMYSYLGLYPSFLEGQLGFSGGQAGFALSMFGIGAMLGIPAGLIGDRYNQRWLIIGSIAAAIIVGYLIFNWATSPAWHAFLSFLEGAFASGFLYTNVYSLIQRSVPGSAVGRASGVFVSALYLPATISGYVFGYFEGVIGWGGAADVQLVAIPVIGIIAMLFLDYTRVRRPIRAQTGGAT